MHDSENQRNMTADLIQTPLTFFIVLHLCARSDPARTNKDDLLVGGMSILDFGPLNAAHSEHGWGSFVRAANQAVKM